MRFREYAKLEVSTEPLCGSAAPKKLSPISWFCAKLNMWAISEDELKEMSRLNNNCPGCITEAHSIGKCKANPHRRVG